MKKDIFKMKTQMDIQKLNASKPRVQKLVIKEKNSFEFAKLLTPFWNRIGFEIKSIKKSEGFWRANVHILNLKNISGK